MIEDECILSEFGLSTKDEDEDEDEDEG